MTRSTQSPAGRLILVMGAVIVCAALPARADLWYEHYSRAEQAIEDQEWTVAVREINEALERKGDSGARVRSYGMKVTSYFPYLQLGVAYYNLGQFDAAMQAFETEIRLGAIAQSEAAGTQLEHYRSLVREALAAAEADEQRRIRQIVAHSLDDARALAARDLLLEAMAAVDQALAVAPDDVDAQGAMSELRQRLAEREQEQERERTAVKLVESGRALLREQRYSEATSDLRQALFLNPSAEAQELLAAAERDLRAELEAAQSLDAQRPSVDDELEAVRALETAQQISAALDRLQSVLILAPANQEARSIQGRLLQARKDAEARSARQATIARLLTEAGAQVDAGSATQVLAIANRVLALDPANSAALKYVAQAYGTISRTLLGTGPKRNIPPAVRFVDLRLEDDDGALLQTIRSPDFRLDGVIIDNTPVDVTFFGDDSRALEAGLNSQPLGDFYLTEFTFESTLPPGLSTFRLVAKDADDVISSSEYSVLYARPFFRAPWFYACLLAGSVALCLALVRRRLRHRERLRTRRFNPYVAGAPVLDDDMFFGRRELVDRILQTIHNNSLLIYGERRIGKTSIQHQIKKRLRDLDDPIYDFHPVYVDLQGTPETRFFQTIAEDIFQELGPLLDGLKPATDVAGQYSYRDFVRDVRAVLRALRDRTSKKVKLVLLIDEVDELNDYDPRINQKLRSLFMKSFAENLVAVVSGVEIKKHWEREGSPWYNFFEEVEVKAFGPQEARELIERPISSIFKLDKGVVERIMALTAGRPYLIQKLCIALVTRLYAQHRRRITVADVEAVAFPTVRDTEDWFDMPVFTK